jgi:hypothetical protein
MSPEQLTPVLYAHWRLLWPLTPEARRQVIAELEQDYLFEMQLGLVASEMEDGSHARH